jgi:CheY-like chemotaxis protein
MAMIFEQQRSARPHALIVDDSQIARYVLSDMLERFDIDVEVAESAEIGLQKIRESGAASRFDVVFMDYLLPGIDGLEAVRRLRAREATVNLPVVMYTSEDSPEFRNRAGDAGANDVLVKTAGRDTLANIMKRLGVRSATPSNRDASGNVIRMRGGHGGRPASETADVGGMKLLARSLEAHHASLRSDLLAEFAILERHEEKMRSELASRVNLVARYTVAQLQKSAEASRREHVAERQKSAQRVRAQASMFAVAMALVLVLGWQGIRSYSALDARLEATTAALETQSRTLEALRDDVRAGTAPTAAATDVSSDVSAMPISAAPGVTAPAAGSAAAALVGELQSMGIMGPIRIETDAGAFCVRAAQNGYRIQGGSLSFSECEPLPLWTQTTP